MASRIIEDDVYGDLYEGPARAPRADRWPAPRHLRRQFHQAHRPDAAARLRRSGSARHRATRRAQGALSAVAARRCSKAWSRSARQRPLPASHADSCARASRACGAMHAPRSNPPASTFDEPGGTASFSGAACPAAWIVDAARAQRPRPVDPARQRRAVLALSARTINGYASTSRTARRPSSCGSSPIRCVPPRKPRIRPVARDSRAAPSCPRRPLLYTCVDDEFPAARDARDHRRERRHLPAATPVSRRRADAPRPVADRDLPVRAVAGDHLRVPACHAAPRASVLQHVRALHVRPPLEELWGPRHYPRVLLRIGAGGGASPSSS